MISFLFEVGKSETWDGKETYVAYIALTSIVALERIKERRHSITDHLL